MGWFAQIMVYAFNKVQVCGLVHPKLGLGIQQEMSVWVCSPKSTSVSYSFSNLTNVHGDFEHNRLKS